VATGKRLKKRVGRSVATKPETLNEEEVSEEIPASTEDSTEDGFVVDPAEEAAARLQRAQENEWDQIKVRWAPETRHQVMSEFLREKGLYAELAKYARKRIR
jgi:hypothetical protein